MAEYIDRDRLFWAFEKESWFNNADRDDVAEPLLLAAPAEDVVPVVRCKDCKHYGWDQEPCHGRVQRFCKLHKGLVVVDKETFCSYGERKDGE